MLHLTGPDGTPIAAVFGVACNDAGGPLADASRKPTVLYFYGNASSAAWSEPEFDHLRRLGANVVVADYLGFGASGGEPSEAGCYAAADAAYDYVVKFRGTDPKRVVAVGWSLGGAVAIDLASRRPVGAVAVLNAFTSMPDMAGQLLPWLPGRWLVRSRFDNVAKLGGVRVPVLVCNGGRDTLVPSAMSDRLAAAAAGSVTRVTVRSADHNTIFTAEPAVVWASVGRLIDEVR